MLNSVFRCHTVSKDRWDWLYVITFMCSDRQTPTKRRHSFWSLSEMLENQLSRHIWTAFSTKQSVLQKGGSWPFIHTFHLWSTSSSITCNSIHRYNGISLIFCREHQVPQFTRQFITFIVNSGFWCSGGSHKSLSLCLCLTLRDTHTHIHSLCVWVHKECCAVTACGARWLCSVHSQPRFQRRSAFIFRKCQ